MNTDLAKTLSANVQDFYEQHGAWFATTRGKVIPEQAFVSSYIQSGMTVVDVGAGNGRFATLLPQDVVYIGIEPSETLRNSAQLALLPGHLPSLPLPDATSDVTVCLATLHHIPTTETRRASIEELIRVTKPGGIILATSWLRNPHNLTTTEITGAEPGDIWMPWQGLEEKDKGQRYVHFMQPGEWSDLWSHPKLELVQIGMYGKKDWTDNEQEALNWRVIAKRR
jgi:ubiquinone/menaquinone biosynthesis C-methylase UbiE